MITLPHYTQFCDLIKQGKHIFPTLISLISLTTEEIQYVTQFGISQYCSIESMNINQFVNQFFVQSHSFMPFAHYNYESNQPL